MKYNASKMSKKGQIIISHFLVFLLSLAGYNLQRVLV
jgi:hypothetical protein